MTDQWCASVAKTTLGFSFARLATFAQTGVFGGVRPTISSSVRFLRPLTAACRIPPSSNGRRAQRKVIVIATTVVIRFVKLIAVGVPQLSEFGCILPSCRCHGGDAVILFLVCAGPCCQNQLVAICVLPRLYSLMPDGNGIFSNPHDLCTIRIVLFRTRVYSEASRSVRLT